jgi:hypothetical protein
MEKGIIFPPPNNLLNKYMVNMAKHGVACEFDLKRRGDRYFPLCKLFKDPYFNTFIL